MTDRLQFNHKNIINPIITYADKVLNVISECAAALKGVVGREDNTSTTGFAADYRTCCTTSAKEHHGNATASSAARNATSKGAAQHYQNHAVGDSGTGTSSDDGVNNSTALGVATSEGTSNNTSNQRQHSDEVESHEIRANSNISFWRSREMDQERSDGHSSGSSNSDSTGSSVSGIASQRHT